MLKKTLVLTLLLTISSATQAEVLCYPHKVKAVMVKSNGDIIYYNSKSVGHLAFKASEMPIHLASVLMISLNEAMVMRPKNSIYLQSTYPDGYDCTKEDLTTAPLRIFFDQSRSRG